MGVAGGAAMNGHRSTFAGLSCVALLGCARLAVAQNDPRAVNPERPSVATHAYTIAPGYLEIETGVERDRIARATSYATPTLFKLGVSSRVQFDLFGTSLHADGDRTRLGDVGAGVKWRFTDRAPLLGAFSLQPSVVFPTGSVAHGASNGTTDVTLLAISSHSFGAVSMDANVGVTHRNGGGVHAPTSATAWSLSFGRPVVGPWGWVGEAFGYPGTSGPSGYRPSTALLAGPTYLVRPSLALDAGAVIRLSGPQPNALYAGATANVGRILQLRD